jgi:hypothetical protein
MRGAVSVSIMLCVWVHVGLFRKNVCCEMSQRLNINLYLNPGFRVWRLNVADEASTFICVEGGRQNINKDNWVHRKLEIGEGWAGILTSQPQSKCTQTMSWKLIILLDCCFCQRLGDRRIEFPGRGDPLLTLTLWLTSHVVFLKSAHFLECWFNIHCDCFQTFYSLFWRAVWGCITPEDSVKWSHN